MSKPAEPISLVEPAPSPPEPSDADQRALRGILMAWVALILAATAWICCLVFLGAFRADAVVGPWLVAGSAATSVAGSVLSWLARRRVRDASPLHASLDFVSAFAWHVSWTALLLTLMCTTQAYSAWKAAQEELLL